MLISLYATTPSAFPVFVKRIQMVLAGDQKTLHKAKSTCDRVCSIFAQPISSNNDDIRNMSIDDIDALPSLDDLIAKGEAQRVLFHGDDLTKRFHMATRALNGEFSHADPEADNESNEGAIEAALTTFPATMKITAVGRTSVNALYEVAVKEIAQGISSDGSVGLEAKARSGGERLFVNQ